MFPVPIPIGTERRLQSFPYATVTLIVVNVFVFLVLQPLPGGEDFSLVPTRFRWWMPVTYMFAHGDLFHLGGNMLFLWVFGPHAEDALGRGRFLLVYFSAGFFSAGLHVAASRLLYPGGLQVGLVGASGAIMGIVALFALRFHGVMVRFLWWWWFLIRVFTVRALWVGIAYVAMNLLFALMDIGVQGGGVAYWAHLGGFAAGAVWAWALRLQEEGTDEIRRDEVSGFIAAGAGSAEARLLEERLAHRPDDPDLHRQAAACYEMIRGGAPRAMAHWNEHLRLLLLASQFEAAATQFRRVLQHGSMKPKDFYPAILLRLGAACERVGYARLAITAWLGVPREHHDSPEAPKASLRAAELMSATGQTGHAQSLYRAIVEHWPDSHEALAATQKLGGGTM